MTIRQARYSKEEHARRGTAIYEERLRPLLERDNRGKVVAIDVEGGEFEVAEDMSSAADRLLIRVPDAQIWFVRIGHPGVHRFGLRSMPGGA